MVDPGPGRRARRGGDDDSDHEPRHGGGRALESFASSFAALGDLALAGGQVSASVSDLDSGDDLLSVDEHLALPVGQLGAVLLLIEVSARIEDGTLRPLDELERPGAPGDQGPGGVWPYLRRTRLPVTDAATLVGAFRDAAAIDALIGLVGLAAVRARGESLGLTKTALLDVTRATRGPDDAPALAVGTAHELAGLAVSLARGEVVDRSVSNRVLGWLSLGADTSLVAAPFGLDPLGHRRLDHDLQIVHATGGDAGVRAELGVLRGPRRSVAYCVVVTFDELTLAHRLRALEAVRAVGTDALEYVH
ncbi:serine hydrolase [Frigoribacterium sp. VKM Ac-1396]|uniref:serine hydrolase n=1 Tax=Frigoribacterium sp. VKM Ac-1396 TaxID=2783821 RepID=UPI00188D81CF|nr:serine hydrolase [Frigoribacterium sp. VKM Ac-1396]MBF4601988.1 serine hydrolase [Frigoribacterium sp. VKM Ac-1396]